MLGHTGKSTQPFTFTGKWGVRQESATLYHMRARYYDTTTARFISRDPIGAQIADAKEINPYMYGIGNPLVYIDPIGADIIVVGNSGAQNPTSNTLQPKISVKPVNPANQGYEYQGAEGIYAYVRERYDWLSHGYIADLESLRQSEDPLKRLKYACVMGCLAREQYKESRGQWVTEHAFQTPEGAIWLRKMDQLHNSGKFQPLSELDSGASSGNWVQDSAGKWNLVHGPGDWIQRDGVWLWLPRPTGQRESANKFWAMTAKAILGGTK
jgi:RHS repeat-associated protein